MEIFLFITGLVFASFINALAYRLRGSEGIGNIWTSPSHCENCKKNLRWYDLVPVLSYLYTKGRCSRCGEKVYWYYPLSELFLAISFSLFYVYSAPILSYLILVYLFFLSYWDVKDKSIPKTVVDYAFYVSAIYALLNIFMSYNLISVYALVFVALLYSLGLVVNMGKEKIGIGDVIVFATIILAMGIKVGAISILATILMSGVYAIYLVLKDKRNRKRYIPLVPFITLGYAVAILVTDGIMAYFANMLPII